MPIKIRVSEEWDIVGSGGGSAGGSDKDIQFNDGGDLNGSENFTWNNTTNLLNINEKISINASGAFGVGASPDYGAIGKALFSQGSAGNPTWDFINNHAIDTYTFNAQGDYSTAPACAVQTWTVPSNGTHALVILWGGGGGGGNRTGELQYGAGGGGGGGCALGFFSFEELGGSGATIKLSVGDGGRTDQEGEERGEAGGYSTFGCDDSCAVGIAVTSNGQSYFMKANGGSGGGVGDTDADGGGLDAGALGTLIKPGFDGSIFQGGSGRGAETITNAFGYSAIFGGAGGSSGYWVNEAPAQSIWGGNGGLGGGGNGQVPGGGGGGRRDSERGTTLPNGECYGGHGQVKIWIF
jgi:hypothetical protein